VGLGAGRPTSLIAACELSPFSCFSKLYDSNAAAVRADLRIS